MSKILDKAAKFVEGFTAPPPPRGVETPKAWDVRLGQFDLPDDQEFAATECRSPPCLPSYPHDTLGYIHLEPGGAWAMKYCVRLEDGRWIELVGS